VDIKYDSTRCNDDRQHGRGLKIIFFSSLFSYFIICFFFLHFLYDVRELFYVLWYNKHNHSYLCVVIHFLLSNEKNEIKVISHQYYLHYDVIENIVLYFKNSTIQECTRKSIYSILHIPFSRIMTSS